MHGRMLSVAGLYPLDASYRQKAEIISWQFCCIIERVQALYLMLNLLSEW